MNPFHITIISLLAGVAGAAVYDHAKGKGSMAKHQFWLHSPNFPPSSPAKSMKNNILMMVIPLLNGLEFERENAAMSGDEKSYQVLSLEIENVENLMNQLIEGLASATADELQAIHQYKGRLGMIKKELEFLSGYDT